MSLHTQELLLPLRRQRKKGHVPVSLLTWPKKPQKQLWRDFREMLSGLWKAAQITARNRVKLQGTIGENPSTAQGSQASRQTRRKRAPSPVFPILLFWFFLHLYLCRDLSGWYLAFFVVILSVLHNTSQGINKRIKLLGQPSWSPGSDTKRCHHLSFDWASWLKGGWK